MDTNTSLTILVWILSITLLIFLVLSIVVLTYTIKVLQDLKQITAKAERLAESAEAVGEFFRKSAGPVAFGKFVANVAETVAKHKQANKGSKDE